MHNNVPDYRHSYETKNMMRANISDKTKRITTEKRKEKTMWAIINHI